MKKLFILLLVICLVLSGCGKEKTAKSDNEPKTEFKNKYLDIETYNMLFEACRVATTDERVVNAIKEVGKTHIYIDSKGISYEHDIEALKGSINGIYGADSISTSQEYSISLEYKDSEGIVVKREKYPEN